MKLDLEILKLLLEKGLDVEARDSQGRTPLLYASGAVFFYYVLFLLSILMQFDLAILNQKTF